MVVSDSRELHTARPLSEAAPHLSYYLAQLIDSQDPWDESSE
jgi:hypothetical protein